MYWRVWLLTIKEGMKMVKKERRKDRTGGQMGGWGSEVGRKGWKKIRSRRKEED